MYRFFCDQLHALNVASNSAGAGIQALSDAVVELDAQESHHAVRVLRLQEGDHVELLDGKGRVAEGVIRRVGKRVSVRVEQVHIRDEVLPRLDVAVTIPKGPRADAMIEQLSQLGVDRVIPLRTFRSVVDPRESKLERFARAAIESAKQCGRARFMLIEPPADFADLLVLSAHDLRLIASPGAGNGAMIERRLREAQSLLVLVGPEGGFAKEEVEQAVTAGCLPWRLGPHVMRIETAAAAAAAIIRGVTCSEVQP